MKKAELESKHLAELHALAAKAGVERYRMLSRGELVEKLLDGDSGTESAEGRRRSSGRGRRGGRSSQASRGRGPGESAKRKPPPQKQPAREQQPAQAAERPQRKRRRRRFRRRRKGVRVHELLLPPAPGRQTIVYGEGRDGCTVLLRDLAAELCKAKGPDPIALLIDPSPEELADWKREAPRAEIVSAGQERHATDALDQAGRRAEGGDDVVFMIDSLSRLDEAFGAANLAKDLFDASMGVGEGGGSLTVVAALERQ